MSNISNLKQIEDAEQADTIRSLKETPHMALVQGCGSGEFTIRHSNLS